MISALPAFQTAIEDIDGVLVGPWRTPRQMLADQEYGGHASIHDDETAQKLGFKGGTIEGPTHFSQFGPLGFAVWGERWFAEGCLSVQYRAACYEGEQVRAFMTRPAPDQAQTEIWMERADGTEILRGTASVGAAHPLSAVQAKLEDLKSAGPWVILRDVEPGMRRPRITVRMDADTRMGRLYPFSLSDKLAVITEGSPWFGPQIAPPWGRAVIPLEMVSVLLNHLASEDPWTIHGPTVDLFTDQEITMIDGPLFVGEPYEIEREVVARSGTRRTEALWVKTTVYRRGDDQPVATMLLSTASLKDSYAEYEADLARLA
ncbi:MAG: hypothetical protein Q8L66_14865 [Caulobacter sp.]|nr:hypothetical protein [Caulobacter sp.]